MILIVAQDIEQLCPHCPYQEPGQYAEFLYRNGEADLDALLAFTHRLRTYQILARRLSEEIRESLANVLNIPAHHRAIREV
jgi:hypothetical protein